MPAPPSSEVTVLVVLFCTPEPTPITLTEKVQLADAAKVAPDRLTDDESGVATMVPLPHDPAPLPPCGSGPDRAETQPGLVIQQVRSWTRQEGGSIFAP